MLAANTPVAFGLETVTRSGSVIALAADDDIPGDSILPSPIAGELDSTLDTDDLYRVWLNVGDVITASLTATPDVPGFNPLIVLYAPGTPAVLGHDPVVHSLQTSFPKSIAFRAPASGEYYLGVYQAKTDEGDPALTGDTLLSWAVSRPVYRFYNPSQGVHFYTATEDEKSRVIATLSDRFVFEGAAYGANPYTNADTLWRFYRPGTGTHFYSADPDEVARTRATLGHIYQYEGPAYAVSRGNAAGRLTVWRFYNRRTGTHFYTANEAERNDVIARLGQTYTYEGAAFYVGQ